MPTVHYGDDLNEPHTNGASTPTTENHEVITRSNPPSSDVSETERTDSEGAAESGSESETSEASFDKRYRALQKRKKLATKRAKQYNEYVALLEERLCMLEERLDKYMGIKETKSVADADEQNDSTSNQDEDDAPEDDAAAKLAEAKKKAMSPELHHAFWSKFEDPSTHVIDVLIGNPELPESKKRVSMKRLLSSMYEEGLLEDDSIQKEESTEELERRLVNELNAMKGKRLPERIRFNSAWIQLLLEKFLNMGAPDAKTYSRPGLHVLRPYKPLVNFDKEIRAQIKDFLAKLHDLIDASAKEEADHRAHSPPRPSRPSSPKIDGEADTNSADGVDVENGVDGEVGVEAVESVEAVEAQEGEKATEPPNVKDRIIGQTIWDKFLNDNDLFCCKDCTVMLDEQTPTLEYAEIQAKALTDFIDEYIKPVALPIHDGTAKKIRFFDLWHLFQPGYEILSKPGRGVYGELRPPLALRVLRTHGGRQHIHPKHPAPMVDSTAAFETDERVRPINGVNPFCVDAFYMDFDGSIFTPVRRRFTIPPYTGERSITELDAYPMLYAAPETRDMLKGRGENFTKLVSSNAAAHMLYKGVDLTSGEEMNDQVIVDMKEYFKLKEAGVPIFQPPESLDISEVSDCPEGADCSDPHCGHRSQRILVDIWTDKFIFDEYLAQENVLQAEGGKLEAVGPEFAEEDYVICHYRVFAYRLRSRKWVQVYVGNLSEVKPIEDSMGFDLLVLPESHKHILLSQVQEHFRRKTYRTEAENNTNTVDLVRGKGEGLIILLHGAPGVGKTCTAECIADLVRKPLFPITCGDLGTTANEVEEHLLEHFQLASRWDCVMLLDEADVFLAKRGKSDYHRNSIVSVFLRMMEYYKGILFLTTNRIGSFDEAFKSRVHISLFYPDFDRDTTVAVWKTFIDKAKRNFEAANRNNVKIKAKEIRDFAREHWELGPETRWNGRQIRNAFQTAIAMAEYSARTKAAKKAAIKKKEGEKGEKEGEPSEPYTYGSESDFKVVIGADQFKIIAATVKDFDDYLVDTLGDSYAARAEAEQMRRYTPEPNLKTPSKKGKGSKLNLRTPSKKEETESEDDDSDDEEEESDDE